ncbi:hypothetical protein [uncultured Marinobacter sp.]|uniref:hypothetical protein n=1 Tax=uncultured Marinobacter sp. TaxID=187379 RepID=UPI002582A6E7|nr:hypothetical protein [uncultured Marinobacter sp.]
MRKLIWSAVFLIVALVVVSMTGCVEAAEPTSSEKGAAVQEQNMKRAQAKVQTPVVSNYLSREAVKKWVQRMDRPQKLFYVYILADTGNVIGYYVSQTRPISECAALTSPVRKERADLGQYQGHMQMPSPGLDGVYYSYNCSQGEAFFFDAETDAFIGISGLSYFVADQPLNLEAEPISVAASRE